MTSAVGRTIARVVGRPYERSACCVFVWLAPTPKRHFDEVIVWRHSCQMAQPQYNLALVCLTSYSWRSGRYCLLYSLVGRLETPVDDGCLLPSVAPKMGCCDSFYVPVVSNSRTGHQPPSFSSQVCCTETCIYRVSH
jgi:hypothetical protein